jgi:hypothetical protein
LFDDVIPNNARAATPANELRLSLPDGNDAAIVDVDVDDDDDIESSIRWVTGADIVRVTGDNDIVVVVNDDDVLEAIAAAVCCWTSNSRSAPMDADRDDERNGIELRLVVVDTDVVRGGELVAVVDGAAAAAVTGAVAIDDVKQPWAAANAPLVLVLVAFVAVAVLVVTDTVVDGDEHDEADGVDWYDGGLLPLLLYDDDDADADNITGGGCTCGGKANNIGDDVVDNDPLAAAAAAAAIISARWAVPTLVVE